ncbi:MAG: ABC transporter ATP-binding protein [Candidatus Limiplasma sp.]|nr:ABC transporter ATP-binding protein [Candidatus Limiplasma sp.]
MDDYYVYTDRMTVGYDGVPLIENIHIGVRRGEILTLIGPNGSGKSTILKSMIRQLRFLAGTVVLDGRAMAALTERDVAKKMSILMTERMKPELMTCRDVVATGRYPYTGRLGLLTPRDWEKVDEALNMVHAGELAERPFTRISDGQRQRLLLARAICQEPEVVVLDEPTSFLDIRHKLELLDILKAMVRAKRVAVIMALHELDLAQKVSDRVVCVNGSSVERTGTPEEIFQDGYIRSLYGIRRGSYNTAFGCLEMEPVCGPPSVFVIGGGGAGIPLYRLLQRRGIPFAAGVLQENDIDYPVAKALASEVISERPFEPIGEETIKRALQTLDKCDRAVCCAAAFGEMNRGNLALREYARDRSILMDASEIQQFVYQGS